MYGNTRYEFLLLIQFYFRVTNLRTTENKTSSLGINQVIGAEESTHGYGAKFGTGDTNVWKWENFLWKLWGCSSFHMLWWKCCISTELSCLCKSWDFHSKLRSLYWDMPFLRKIRSFVLITGLCLLGFIYAVMSLKSIIYEVSQATVSLTSFS